MPIAENSPDSEQELRWRAWQEKGRCADRLADKWTKVLFSVIGLILLAGILYYTLRAKASPDSDHVQRAVACDHVSTRVALCLSYSGELSRPERQNCGFFASFDRKYLSNGDLLT